MTADKRIGFASERYCEYPGSYADKIESELENLRGNRFLERFFELDHTLWADDPEEISNRLGWVRCPETMLRTAEEVEDFSDSAREKGFADVLVLGMGGSSLSSEVFKNVFDAPEGAPRLSLLDTTDPDFILKTRKSTDLSNTLFVVSSKSGSTVETFSLMKYFHGELLRETPNAGKNFICVTDPGSKLVEIARAHGFAKVFLNNPDIGGRFSALSCFGLVPASLAGIDIKKILMSASLELLDLQNASGEESGENPCVRFGTFLGTMAREGRDKLGFVFSDRLSSFGCWAEQLIAESTGKNGTGILPVLDERDFDPSRAGNDRMTVILSERRDPRADDTADRLADSGVPFVKITVDDPYQIGAEFFRFEFAVALAGSLMGINPFNQPDVESAKIFAKNFLERYMKEGGLESPERDFSVGKLAFSSNEDITSIDELRDVISSRKEGSYVSLQAYVDPGKEIAEELLALRETVDGMTSVPVTLGFGPRFLHSTGQLHKGDSGNAFFVQIVSENENDLPIPDDMCSAESGLSFGILKKAQATGDFMSLDEKGRSVVSIRVPSNVSESVREIRRLLA